MYPPPLRLALSLTLAAALFGCSAPSTVKNTGARLSTPIAKPSIGAIPAPPGLLEKLAPALLSGTVSLIANNGGGVLSNHGSALISDVGGSVISDHGGAIISNNSGAIISNHAGSYHLRSADTLATFLLAEATIRITDAAGNPIAGQDGKPIEVKTDGQGAYTLRTDLPVGNLVARVTLFNGGELSALIVREGTGPVTLNLDTASTLGATYVLEKFVKGDQAILNRLPRMEAERLRTELDVVRGYLASAPSYMVAESLPATESLRTKVPGVNRVMEDVRALLLGQSQLGSGLLATSVGISGPTGLLVEPSGNVLFAEFWPGRLRSVGVDGKIATLMDGQVGTIKSNILRINDVARAADGTLYVASETLGVYRVLPGATVVSPISADFWVLPKTLTTGPDGTLYIGEFTWTNASKPRLLMLKPNASSVDQVVLPDESWLGGQIVGLTTASDGTMHVLYDGPHHALKLYQVKNGVVTTLPDPQTHGEAPGDMAQGLDGTLYVSLAGGKRIVALSADGTVRTVAGLGGPAGSEVLQAPGALSIGADGTLYIADNDSALVYAMKADGTFRRFAGADSIVQAGETTQFAINQPMGVAFDADDNLLIVETGSARVRRYRNGTLEEFAGSSTKGNEGDGGAAQLAKMTSPIGIVQRAGEVWLADAGGERVRHIGLDGLIDTTCGSGNSQATLAVGAATPAVGPGISQPFGITVDAHKHVYFSSNQTNQITRFTPGADGGTIEVIAGINRPDTEALFVPEPYLQRDEKDPASPLGYPLGLAMGPDGLPYFAEMIGGRVARIKGLDGNGPVMLERVAGRTLYDMIVKGAEATENGTSKSPDNVPATETTLVLPTGVAFDAAGNMYVSEAGTTYIGTLGGISRSQSPLNPELLDALGLPRIGGRVRKIAKNGTITTVAGVGSRYFADATGDNALNTPIAIAISRDGRMAIADMGANMVRILPAGSF